MRSVSDGEGGSFFADHPEMLSATREKIGRHLFAVVARLACQTPESSRTWAVLRSLAGFFSQFSDPGKNEFLPLSNQGYSEEDHESCLLQRTTRRSGMILNSEELVGLVHLPSESVRVAKLRPEEKSVTRTKKAPDLAVGHHLVLGENEHDEKITKVSLAPIHRARHLYVIGTSGTGKSTLILNLILQDIANQQGVAVLDPHGDLVDQVLANIPEDRLDDLIFFDPADEEYSIGFNILSAQLALARQENV